MRGPKILALCLAVTNLALLFASIRPPAPAELRAIVTATPRVEARVDPARRVVPFGVYGHTTDSPDRAGDVGAAPASAPPAETIDDKSFIYLGQMLGDGSVPLEFLKDTRSNRVYTANAGDGSVKILSESKQEMIFEIDGKKYRVYR